MPTCATRRSGWRPKGREVLANIANAYRRMGLYERAESYFNELEHDYRQLGDEEHLVDIHSQQGSSTSTPKSTTRRCP